MSCIADIAERVAVLLLDVLEATLRTSDEESVDANTEEQDLDDEDGDCTVVCEALHDVRSNTIDLCGAGLRTVL